MEKFPSLFIKLFQSKGLNFFPHQNIQALILKPERDKGKTPRICWANFPKNGRYELLVNVAFIERKISRLKLVNNDFWQVHSSNFNFNFYQEKHLAQLKQTSKPRKLFVFAFKKFIQIKFVESRKLLGDQFLRQKSLMTFLSQFEL